MKYILLLSLLFTHAASAQKTMYSDQSMAKLEMPHGTGNFIEGTLSSNNFDVKYYRCEWEVDPAVRYIKGKVTVYFKMTDASADVTLDLTSVLTTDSVTYHGTQTSFIRPTSALKINFPATLNSGVFDSLSIYYKGVPDNTGFGSFIQDVHAGTPVIWTLSEAYGAKDWWPCKNGNTDKADSIDVYLTYPSQYKGASNGMLQSETAAGPGKTTAHWKHRYPISTYLICLAVTNYTTFTQTVQLGNVTLPMVTYCYPESLAAFQAGTPNVLDAMKLFSRLFGEYPFIKEKYGHVQFNWGGGMEHQTSTFVVSAEENLTSHELGHQWFGDKITCASWEDIWLNEGFAAHLAALYLENKYPTTYTIPHRQQMVQSITSQPGGSVKVADTTQLGMIFNQRLSYNKGSHLLYMLTLILGEDVFFDALRQYQHDPAVIYGNARTPDLKRNLEQISGKDLTYFFDEWYTGQGYPSYTIKWNMIGTSHVNINVSQITSHPSVAFFHLPIPLKFKNATREQTVMVDNTFNGQDFIRSVDFVPDTVLVDPEYWLVTKNNTTQKIDAGNTGQGIAEIYPNPLAGPLTIFFHDFAEPAAEVSIYNKAGQRMFTGNARFAGGSEYMQIPTESWAKGIYIVRIKTGNNIITKQVMK